MVKEEAAKEEEKIYTYLDRTVIKLCNNVDCATKTPHIHEMVRKIETNGLFRLNVKVTPHASHRLISLKGYLKT